MSTLLECPFFLIIPPGLESLAQAELRHHLGDHPSKVTKGGIEISLDREQGFALNRVLKIPTRILVRVAEFKTRDFPGLYKKLLRVPWRDFVEHGEVHWQVSSTHSRLGQQKRIEQTCRQAYQAFHQGHEPKLQASRHDIEVYVRFDHDLCVVSIDTSGEALYRRGYRPHVAEASLRENLAAALVWRLGQPTQPTELVDPMMGSGTFLLEAYHLLNANTFRTFAYESFPCHKASTPPLASPPHWFCALRGFDKSPKALQSARHNTQLAGLHECELEQADLKERTPLGLRDCQRWVILNPPYGKRLAVQGSSVATGFRRLSEALVRAYPGHRYAILAPQSAGPEKKWLPQGAITEPPLHFRNGGLAVQLVVFSMTAAGKPG